MEIIGVFPCVIHNPFDVDHVDLSRGRERSFGFEAGPSYSEDEVQFAGHSLNEIVRKFEIPLPVVRAQVDGLPIFDAV